MLRSLGLLTGALIAALRFEARRGDAAAAARLTRREREVARLVGRGLQNREIASALGTSPNTVRKQIIRIFEKVGATGRTELAVWVAGLPPEALEVKR
jgi:DNA-binding NarL/FixJ family response regulator